MYPLIVFVDSRCPLCQWEMRHLRRADHQGMICIQDLFTKEMATDWPEVDLDAAVKTLLVIDSEGHRYWGLDATHQLWSALGRGYLTAWLRWPGLRWFADRGYRWFARHRSFISWMLTGKRRCSCAGNDQSPKGMNESESTDSSGA